MATKKTPQASRLRRAAQLMTQAARVLSSGKATKTRKRRTKKARKTRRSPPRRADGRFKKRG